jgi:NADPH:quinone reductase-like Zn-dependent oxidoreductase
MIFRTYGGPEVLELAELPRPVPGPEQILIRVHTSSINPVDWKRASGKLRLIMPVQLPAVPGFDVAGEVVEVGPGVTSFTPGMRVHARLAGGVGGAAAEYTLAGLDVTARMPEGMDMATAAGLPLAGMTALQGLRDRAGVPMQGARERILVVGASGGVGHLAVQIAAAAGATVVGVCSTRNIELVKGLGAHEVIDYTKPDAYAGQAPFDVIFDCVGGSPGPWLPRLKAGGRFVSAMPGPAVFLRSALNALVGKKVRAVMLKPNAADLRFLDSLYEAGKLRVVIDQRFPLTELRAAWERSQSGRAAGKILVDVV